MAKNKKPHTIGETLILPCCKDIVRCILGESASVKLNTLSLSNDTIRRRINEISDDIKGRVLQQMKASPINQFAIQLDESTDVAKCSQLLVFVRYVHDGDFKEEFLFNEQLTQRTRGEDVFQGRHFNF